MTSTGWLFFDAVIRYLHICTFNQLDIHIPEDKTTNIIISYTNIHKTPMHIEIGHTLALTCKLIYTF